MTPYNENTASHIFQHEYEQASNSYLMCVAAIIAGLPLPIINLIASVGFYLAHRKSTFFVRWHCIQAAIAQAVLIPFNSVAVGWTLGIWFGGYQVTLIYIAYLFFIVMLNILEFAAVIYTAIKVRNGYNIRWFIIADITDSLCTRENRDIYKI